MITSMNNLIRYDVLSVQPHYFSYFVKPGSTSEDDLSEETASKLAIGYRKLIKISSESDRNDLVSMVENFESRYLESEIRKGAHI